MKYPEGRAITPEQKRRIVEQILAVWTKPPMNHLRLGQLIVAATRADSTQRIFSIEDEALLQSVEDLGKDHGREPA